MAIAIQTQVAYSLHMKAIFVELPAFAKYRSEYLDDEGFRDLQKKSDIEFQNILDNALESSMATMLLTHFHWPIYGNTDLYDLERNSYCGANPHYREYAYLFDYIVFGHNHEESYTVTEDAIFVNSGSNYECPAYQVIDI